MDWVYSKAFALTVLAKSLEEHDALVKRTADRLESLRAIRSSGFSCAEDVAVHFEYSVNGSKYKSTFENPFASLDAIMTLMISEADRHLKGASRERERVYRELLAMAKSFVS